MKNKNHMLVYAIPAAVCFILALFLRFAVIGYSFTAMLFAALGCLFILFGATALARSRFPLAAKRVFRAVIVLLILGFTAFSAVEIQIISSAKTDSDPKAGYLIVLGAGVNGTSPSLSLVDRLTAALDYLEWYPDAVAIVSGGQGEGEDITEAEAMRIWLERMGVAPERIIKEEASTSTQENIVFSLNIINELGGDPEGRVAICTSEYHLFRAKLIAGNLGADPVAVAGKTTMLSLRINYFVREAFGVMHMLVFGFDTAVISTIRWR